MRVCKGCGHPKKLEDFPSVRRREKVYHLHKCKACDAKRGARYRTTSDNYQKHMKEWAAKRRVQRASGENTASFIMWDSRRIDKRKGRKNDLTKEFIESLISQPCSYCGETNLRMTLDRIDNQLGHLQTNVIPACIRCNYARGDIPYEAWKGLIPGLRKARRIGAFGVWTGRVSRRAGT